MKKVIFISLLLFSTFRLIADDVPIEGGWDGPLRPRSLIQINKTPTPPVVNIDKNVLSIYLKDAISNLYVIIADEKGNIIYKDCISTRQSGYTHSIVLDEFPKGIYSIILLHDYGCLSGFFKL